MFERRYDGARTRLNLSTRRILAKFFYCETHSSPVGPEKLCHVSTYCPASFHLLQLLLGLQRQVLNQICSTWPLSVTKFASKQLTDPIPTWQRDHLFSKKASAAAYNSVPSTKSHHIFKPANQTVTSCFAAKLGTLIKQG